MRILTSIKNRAMRVRVSGMIVCAQILLFGCASEQPIEIVYSHEQKLMAAEYALALDIRLSEIVKACNELDEDSKKLAEEVQRGWWSDNWSYVAAADQLYLNDLRLQQNQKGDVDGQLSALKFKLEASEENGQMLTKKMHRTNLRFQTCRRYLRPYKDRSNAHKMQEEYLPVLKSILSDYPGVATSVPHPVIDYATQYSATRQSGRSYFDVEKTVAHFTECMNPLVLALYDDWPNEVYGVYCQGKEPVSVKCYWGTCDYKVLVE